MHASLSLPGPAPRVCRAQHSQQGLVWIGPSGQPFCHGKLCHQIPKDITIARDGTAGWPERLQGREHRIILMTVEEVYRIGGGCSTNLPQ